jgi:7,8-dihydropterin-6-yl-methyl-4-(beta-D-ribofuranosyl)aminobenzene 5'-phosphate synthase
MVKKQLIYKEEVGNMECTITCLVDNRTSGAGLKAEHGLSFLIQYGGKKYLFDTGQTDVVFRNAEKMGLSLDDIDGLIISHGHSDHTGGVEKLLKELKRPVPIYLHPQALTPRYLKDRNSLQEIGFGLSHESLRELGGNLIYNQQPVQIAPGLWLTGEIPLTIEFETPELRFFWQQEGNFEPDLIPDDQALVLETERGLVVVLGCAHTGIINTLNWIRKFMGREQIYAVLGGTHLMVADESRIRKTAEHLAGYGLERLGVCHCTGFPAAAYLFSSFKEEFMVVEAGFSFSC